MDSPGPRARRCAESVLFIGVWVALGAALRLRANAYLLLGVPLTWAFQKFVRHEPVRALWVREAPRLRVEVRGLLWALALGAVPLWSLVSAARRGETAIALWCLAAVLGAAAAAYAVQSFRRDTLTALLACATVAGSIGVALMAGSAALKHAVTGAPLHFLPQTFGLSIAQYFPALFILEEVSFRGALDSHLQHQGEHRPWLSALLVSSLWGLWHLPIVPHANLPETALLLVLVHCAIGVPLSFYWRKSGNLAVTSFSHALIDAARNALGLF
ncbi:MAG: CPBP family intramembrane metalloprotease [Elusimicrobia bacterium]|nr:CPBP family intramembrane metalloprotease [Elusimicrobiota bacterium]MDE2313424.1 CPBP family intramembrane metalloprotease [Elusimicrobiota bacterium]